MGEYLCLHVRLFIAVLHTPPNFRIIIAQAEKVFGWDVLEMLIGVEA